VRADSRVWPVHRITLQPYAAAVEWALDAREGQVHKRAAPGAKNDGGGVGKGGAGTLFVDGQQVGEAYLSRTVPFLFSADGTDIGIDNGSPVTEEYETPFGRFTGEISWVRNRS
jgi:hypothetical protein